MSAKKKPTGSKPRAPRKPRKPQTADPAPSGTEHGPLFWVHGLDEDFLVSPDFEREDFGNGPLRFMVEDWRPGDEELYTMEEAGVVTTMEEACRLRLEYLVKLRAGVQRELERVLNLKNEAGVPLIGNPFERA